MEVPIKSLAREGVQPPNFTAIACISRNQWPAVPSDGATETTAYSSHSVTDSPSFHTVGCYQALICLPAAAHPKSTETRRILLKSGPLPSFSANPACQQLRQDMPVTARRALIAMHIKVT